jgi:hypothetical protein
MSVLILPDARVHLGMKTGDNDAGLSAAVDSAEAIVSNLVGPLTPVAAATSRLAGGDRLVIPAAPLTGVSAIVTPDGQTVDLSTVTVDLPSGVVYFNDNLTRFSSDAYDVTYTAGWAAIPDDLLWGVKECLREIWQARRGPVRSQDSLPGGRTGWEQWVEPYRIPVIGAA